MHAGHTTGGDGPRRIAESAYVRARSASICSTSSSESSDTATSASAVFRTTAAALASRSRAATTPATVGASKNSRTPDLRVQGGPHLRHEPHREERVPAEETKEVVVDAHSIDPEHLGEESHEDSLERVARLRNRVFTLGGATVEGEKRAPVNLAGGREREPVDRDEGRGHRLRGQALEGKGPQVVGFRSGLAGGDDVRHEAWVRAVRVEDRRLRDRRM